MKANNFNAKFFNPNYKYEKEELTKFIQGYNGDPEIKEHPVYGSLKYMQVLVKI